MALTAFGLFGTDSALTSTGRAATVLALANAAHREPRKPKIALLPPYTCHTVLEPFLVAGYEIHCHTVDARLTTTGEGLLADVERTCACVVLVHRYFGYDTLPGAVAAVETLRTWGVTVIEDRTQSLYRGFAGAVSLPADYLVGSLRKWAGLPDGGFCVCREGGLAGKPAAPDTMLEREKLAASYAKYRYLRENAGAKADFLAQYRRAEEILNAQTAIYAISPISRRVQAGLNPVALMQARRENTAALLSALAGCEGVEPIFPILSPQDVPLYCPIRVQNGKRKALQAHLAAADIYAPVVWPRAESLPPVCAAAEALYSELLCLPIDQRYREDDMVRMAQEILRFYRMLRESQKK